MNVIILCGGLSTRLGDITKTTPKILLPVGDRTVLDWQIEKIKTLPIDRIVLAAGHLADELQAAVGTERGGLPVVYAVEPERLGTGGAIKHALTYVKDPAQPMLILNGDILTTVPLADILGRLRHETDGIILGSRVPDTSSYGTLEYDAKGHLKAFREKEGVARPGYINGGIYLFTPRIQEYFPSDRSVFSIEYDIFPAMKDLYVYESDHSWVDIGVPDRLAWAREHWQEFLSD